MGIIAEQTLQERFIIQMYILRSVLESRFLTAIIGGFFLVAYAWWPWRMGMDPIMAAFYSLFTLILGASQLYEGYDKLQYMIVDPETEKPEREKKSTLPYEGSFRFFSGFMLLVWALAYVNPANRVAFHWPLDLAVTLIAGALMIYYVISDFPHDSKNFWKRFASTEEPEPSPQP